MYIKRHIENTIKEMAGAFPVILLTGPRQVGKSTVIRKAFPEIKYLTLDDRIVLNALHEDAIGFLQMQGTPLVVDEVQREAEAFLGIKYIVDGHRKSGMYMLTGSQKYELMQGVSESLAGRIGIINMLGLSMREILGNESISPFLPVAEYIKSQNIAYCTPQKLWEIIHKGSMPELYSNENMPWEAYYASYVDTYIERDVRALAQVGNTLNFVQFMTSLAARTGELLNIHAIAGEIGIDDKTAKRWLSILQASGIIYLLKPFSLNVNKRLVKTPKVYFMDTGLVCYLCRWLTPETLQNGAMAGGIFETYVISEIIKSYYNAGREPDIYFFRNTDRQEVDLLFFENGTLYPVEIKKTASPNIKDLKHFKTLETYFPSLKIGEGGIICTYPSAMPMEKNRWIIPYTML